MEKGDIDEIIRCYATLRSQNTAEISEATEKLMAYYHDPSILPTLLSISAYTSDSYIIQEALIAASQYLDQNFSKIPQDMLQSLIPSVISLISSSQNDEFARNTCYIAEVILHRAPSSENTTQFINLALSLVQSPSQALVGIRLWSDLCYELEPSVIQPYLPPLLDCVLSTISSPTRQMRILGLSLFQGILSSGVDTLALPLSAPFKDQLRSIFSSSLLSDPDNEEASLVMEIVTFLFDTSFEQIEDVCQYFIHFSFSLLRDQSSPSTSRFIDLSLFTSLAKSSPSLFAETLDDILSNVFALMSTECANDRSNFSPMFADELLSALSEEPDFSPLITDFLISASASGQPSDFQVSLICLSYLSEHSFDTFSERSEDIVNMIEEGLHSGDFELISASTDLLATAADSCGSIFDPYIDRLLISLFAVISHPNCLRAMDELLRSASKPPSDVFAFIQNVSQLMSPDSSDSVVSCITAAISNLNGTNEELYNELRSFLVEWLSNGGVRNRIFECFSFCSSIAPRMVAGDLPQICEAMQASFSIDSPDLACEIASSVGSFASVLPESFREFSGSFIELFNQIIQSEGEADISEKAKGEAMKSIASICRVYPQANEFPVSKTKEWLKGDNSTLVIFACQAIVAVGDGLCNGNGLADAVISKIQTSNDEDEIVELLKALASILAEAPSTMSREECAKVDDFFIEVFKNHVPSLCNELELLDRAFEAPLFFAFESYVLGGLIKSSKAELLESLLRFRDGLKKDVNGYSTLAISRAICSDGEEQASSEISRLCSSVLTSKRISENLLNSYFTALTYYVIGNPGLFSSDIAKRLKDKVMKSISSCKNQFLSATSSLFLLALIAFTDANADEECIKASLAQMPPPTDIEDIALFAKSLYGLYLKGVKAIEEGIVNYCCQIFASSDWCLRSIAPDVIEFLTQNLRAAGESAIENYANGREAALIRIRGRLHLQQ